MRHRKVWLQCVGVALLTVARMPAETTGPTTTATTFKIHSFDGSNKCLDYSTPGANPSVFLNDCQYAHPITVQEVNSRHQVILHAGTNQVIGIKKTLISHDSSLPSTAITGATEYPLQLIRQTVGPVSVLATVDDVFALDGDSIILESSRPCVTTDTDTTPCPAPPAQLVVQVPDGVELDATPLVVAPRNFADSEFWDFAATDNSGEDPTSGFVTVATNYDLWNAICAFPAATASRPPSGPCGQFRAGWGSVIRVNLGPDIDASIDLSLYPPLILPAGLTLRGDRRGTNVGPQLNLTLHSARDAASAAIASSGCGWCMIQIHGDYARVTGLRLRGQSRSTAKKVELTVAIQVDFPGSSAANPASSTEYIAMVDHNEISDWEVAGVEVEGGHGKVDGVNTCPPDLANEQGTQANVRIERNFIHHNTRNDAGYGSVMSSGGRSVLVGNTYDMNRHSIAADGEPHGEYRAWYNLVLSSAPTYDNHWWSFLTGGNVEQDFDMHGTGNDPSRNDGFGGIAGAVDIGGNTFLGGNRPNLEYRGKPCYVPNFHDNVTQQSRDSAVNLQGVTSVVTLVIEEPDTPTSPTGPSAYVMASAYQPVLISAHNQYGDSSPGYSNPTANLRTGDFDGDGVEDVFLATGTAWYFAPAGNAEWRLLSPKTDKADTLLFGDFDNDGRTDVVKKSGSYLMVSWGGTSDWEQLNSNPTSAQIADLAVGNFVGDARDDIFWADGKTWWVSDHGAGAFAQSQTSVVRMPNLRFGDFTGSGRTDVFSVVSGKWQVSYGATSSWTPLPVSLTSSVDGLVVADFTGDGKADVARSSLLQWQIWSVGAKSWMTHTILPNSACADAPAVPGISGAYSWPLTSAAAIGHFKGKNASADALVWDDHEFCIVQGDGSPQSWTPTRFSRQEMR
jgi:hypothetical protein